MADNAMISIIIPVYNREKTLPRCLESVLSQTYKYLECILIDDGSIDGSLAICKEFAQRDNRVKVIHKKNGGVSSARNKGLALAKGEWVVFVDSDDFIKNNHLEVLANAITESVDIIFIGFENVGSSTTIKHSYQNGLYIGWAKIREFICTPDFARYQPSCDKMYRRKVISNLNLSFKEGLPISEDRLFCYQYIVGANGIATVDETTYIIDSSDDKSLSQTLPKLDIQFLRYKEFAKGLKNLLNHFDIRGKERKYLDLYNLSLLDMLIHTKYSLTKRIIIITECLSADIPMAAKYAIMKIKNNLQTLKKERITRNTI